MSQGGIYSELKTVWHLARSNLKLPEAPSQVQLILSDLCNQDCEWCAYRMSGYTSNELFVGGSERSPYGHDNPKRWIPTERATRFLDEFKRGGVSSVQFTGGGEPTVHPDHERVFTHALSVGLRCSLVSNGVKWSSSLIGLLTRFDWVRVSIDAGSAAAYAKTRRTPEINWERAWSHVAALAGRIKSVDSKCVLGVGFVVSPESWIEIGDFIRLAASSGAHNARLTAMFSPDNEKPFAVTYPEIKGEIEAARHKYERSDFQVHDNFGSRVDDLKQRAPDYSFCSYQYYTSYVGGDMRAYRCCVLAYNNRGLIDGGNLKDRPWDEFWKDPKRVQDMERLKANSCERCQFNAKNRAWLYVSGNTESDTAPRHLEFP